MLFKSLTNWGVEPMIPDNSVDDNSLLVTVWYQVCTGASGQLNLNYSMTYGNATSVITGGSTVVLVNSHINPVNPQLPYGY